MKILVTGNLGYVGTSLTNYISTFLQCEITGLDAGYYQSAICQADFNAKNSCVKQILKDVRDVTLEDVSDLDAVIHLASLSNDPLGDRFADATMDINLTASMRLLDLCVEAKVRNFVFASSCSIYGEGEGTERIEDDRVSPLTAYAKSKSLFETYAGSVDLAETNFTALRFATACGWSARLRSDIVLNEFVLSALLHKRIDILSDGSPWRPLIDVRDMVKAMAWAVQRSSDDADQFLVLNTGKMDCNYRISELGQAVSEIIPNIDLNINKNASPDKRSYSVNFSKFYKHCPAEFLPEYSLNDSIVDLANRIDDNFNIISEMGIDAFRRLKIIGNHIDAGNLNSSLRFVK